MQKKLFRKLKMVAGIKVNIKMLQTGQMNNYIRPLIAMKNRLNCIKTK
ncbi:hypothetical protein [Thermovenabulum sp.]